mgnify:CR=1 FL=1
MKTIERFLFLHRFRPGLLMTILLSVTLSQARLSHAANILEVAESDGRFKTLVSAVQIAGLTEILKTEAQAGLTVFAPTDAAFAKLPAATLAELVADPVRLKGVLLYHVVKRSLRQADLQSGPLTTVKGPTLQVQVSDGVQVNDARVVVADVEASNGIIHAIDTVLIPPADLLDVATSTPGLGTFLRAAKAAGLQETLAGLGPLTVFAPNDAAFEKVPAATLDALLADPSKLKTVLLYHVIGSRLGSSDLAAGPLTTAQGSTVTIGLNPAPTINGANVVTANVSAINGIVHIIDTVLLPPPSLLQIASDNPDFSTLAAAIQTTGLTTTLQEGGPFTVFAPNNAAFAKLPPGTVETLLANPDRLKSILLYHVVSGRLASGSLTPGALKTVQGASAIISLSPFPAIDNARIVATDIAAANGTVHVIDTVIIPPDDIPGVLQRDASFSTLAAALEAASFVDKLQGEGPFTLFAPSNDAFAKLPPEVLNALLQDPEKLRQLLLYHVVPGRVAAADLKSGVLPTALGGGTGAFITLNPEPKIDNAKIVATDIRAANGIIHVIDSVLVVPPTLGEFAVSNPSFTILATAVQAAGLSDLVLKPGSTTIFAPNDEAFGKLPGGTLSQLLIDTNQLKKILLYHLVKGRVRPADLKQGNLPTLQGASLQIDRNQGLKVNEAEVYLTDIEASNGVLYGIDKVLLPPPDLIETVLGSADFSTLATAVQAAGLEATLKTGGPFTVFAPNNAAFAKLPPDALKDLIQSPAKLRRILLYHVVPGRVRSGDLKSGKIVTAQGAAATVTLSPRPKINDAAIIATDIEADNGVVHVIDSVILPPPSLGELAASNPDFSILATAVEAAGLSRLIVSDRETTVFAPNNAAFGKLPPGTLPALLADTNRLKTILLYHLVRGRVRAADLKPGGLPTLQGAAVQVRTTAGVKIDNATVVAADVEASNGIIHVVDSVLLPPPSILELAIANPDFSTLVAAVKAAGLVETLQAAGPYTLFAPNNAAFDKLPPGTLQTLLENPVRLRHILLYHINHGPRLRSTDLKDGKILTLQGATATIDVNPTGVKINQASVIAANIEALNGVIHVIDEVIIPGDGFSGVSVSAVVKNGKATVVWPQVLGANFKLESSTALEGPWSPLVSDVITADGIQKTEVPVTGPQQFFRIRSDVPAPGQ